MAWNPSPKVAAARDYGEKFGKDIVIILVFGSEKEESEMITYGRTKRLCAAAGKYGDQIWDAIQSDEFDASEMVELLNAHKKGSG